MATLREIFSKRFIAIRPPLDYESCKYEDIDPKSIIHQGQLQYLYSTTILGDSWCMFNFLSFVQRSLSIFSSILSGCINSNIVWQARRYYWTLFIF